MHVSAAKAAVDALSRVLAVEEGPKGVRSNVIAPGPIGMILLFFIVLFFFHSLTQLCVHIGNTEGASRLSNQSKSENNLGAYPLGRIGHLKDVANATIFLFSDAASNITGQILPVDGGFGHMATFQLPYPQAMLDPDSVKHMISPKL